MSTYNFSIACVPDRGAMSFDRIVDALHDAGCNDALVVERAGLIVLEFDREAGSFDQAATSAIQDVIRAGMKPTYLGPDTLVTMADIAERAGITRQAVSLYVSGKRGTDFPRPIAKVDTPSPLWDWIAVAEWFHAKGQVDQEAVEEAHSVQRIKEQFLAAA
jgi:transcriptional regulator with XRE-family HTH domain